jgi:hypothetical protein
MMRLVGAFKVFLWIGRCFLLKCGYRWSFVKDLLEDMAMFSQFTPPLFRVKVFWECLFLFIGCCRGPLLFQQQPMGLADGFVLASAPREGCRLVVETSARRSNLRAICFFISVLLPKTPYTQQQPTATVMP